MTVFLFTDHPTWQSWKDPTHGIDDLISHVYETVGIYYIDCGKVIELNRIRQINGFADAFPSIIELVVDYRRIYHFIQNIASVV